MNLSAQLHKTAEQFPQKSAYVFMDQETSYADLDASVSKFANGLKQLGVKKGDHIALIVGNSPHFVIGLYGALRVGATVIPINPIYTADEISYMLQDGDVKAVIAVDLLLPVLKKSLDTLHFWNTLSYVKRQIQWKVYLLIFTRFRKL